MESDRRSRVARFLRISFSAVCVVLCLLLIALWVRSYFYVGMGGFVTTTNGYEMFSLNGKLFVVQSYPVRSFSHLTTNARFGIGHYSYGYSVSYWLFTALVVLVAALPWLRWRFSLRTLLVATTLVAVVLGLVVYVAS